ncbi:MAG: hypothetical protein ABI855_06200 [Bacteroidota bacterium]
MTLGQTEKINMYLGLDPYLDTTINIWQGVGIFPSIVSKYKLKLAALQADQSLQTELTTGYALDKQRKRIAMATAAYRIKSGLQAFASETDDDILYFKINLSLTALIEGAATRSKSRCEMIHDQAALVIANLGPYAVVAADLIDLQEKITAFNDIISNPKSIKGQRKAVNERIRQTIKDIDTILKRKMDKAAAILNNTAPEWVQDYFTERRIYRLKTQFTEIVATFKNKETGHEVAGVLLKAKGNKGAEFEIVSSSNGVADKKQASPEIYDLTWEIPGFESGEMKQVKVSPGEKEKLVIELIPAN